MDPGAVVARSVPTVTPSEVWLPPLDRLSRTRRRHRVYVHEIELDGDENPTLGQRVEILDEGESYIAARITEVQQTSEGNRYQLTIEP